MRRTLTEVASVAGCSPAFLSASFFFIPMSIINLTGQQFGRLTVLRRGRHKRYWRCRCACGVIKEVRSDALRTDGGTRSCGCLQRAAVSKLGHHHAPGQRFAYLVIVRQSGTLKKRGRVYRCQCDCGKRVNVQGRHLRDGLVKSCGCYYRATRTTTTKHGQCRIKRKTGAYMAYERKRSLCLNPNGRMAKYFHDRGVEFRFASFAEFYAEVGDKPGPDFWLFRVNDSGHFEAGNLEWRQVRRHRKRRSRRKRTS
jgi:hypothetical protein